MKADLAKAFCATNMLTRQCLRHIERLSLDRFYRDRAFVVCRDFRQAGGVGIRPAARQFRWRRGTAESGRDSLRNDRQRATIEAGIEMRVIRPAELKRINVD